jgi:hypothetical protein
VPGPDPRADARGAAAAADLSLQRTLTVEAHPSYDPRVPRRKAVLCAS